MRIVLSPLLTAALLGFVACGGDGAEGASQDQDSVDEENVVKAQAKPARGQGANEPSQDDEEDDPDSCGAACERDAGGSESDKDAGAGGDGAAAMDAGGDAAADARIANADASNDAGGRDANTDTGAAICATPGQSCDVASCCAGAVCIIAPETGSSICAAQCSAPSHCNSNCCVPIRGGNTSACVPASNCSVMTGPVGGGCGALQLIAEDGTYLGDATSNAVAANSVCNRIGVHGSTVGPASIYNSVGIYGSSVSTQSAYSTLTVTPPAILCSNSGEIVAFVTKNQLVAGAPRIDPDALCVVLANTGL